MITYLEWLGIATLTVLVAVIVIFVVHGLIVTMRKGE